MKACLCKGGAVIPIQVALCDDQPHMLRFLAESVGQYAKMKKLDVEINAFSHPDGLLSASGKQRFHLYVLDMVMPMLNGVQLGTEIRRRDQEAQIIYVTSAPEFALGSFTANPLAYLIKPVDQKALHDTLDLAFSKIDLALENTLAIKTSDGLRVLPLSLICCCERLGKSVRYTLVTGEILDSVTIRGSFSESVAPLLEDRRFIQPHVSFVVNMSLVERLNEQGFVMRDGQVVPIAQKQYAAIRKTYLDYRFAKGRTFR